MVVSTDIKVKDVDVNLSTDFKTEVSITFFLTGDKSEDVRTLQKLFGILHPGAEVDMRLISIQYVPDDEPEPLATTSFDDPFFGPGDE